MGWNWFFRSLTKLGRVRRQHARSQPGLIPEKCARTLQGSGRSPPDPVCVPRRSWCRIAMSGIGRLVVEGCEITIAAGGMSRVQ